MSELSPITPEPEVLEPQPGLIDDLGIEAVPSKYDSERDKWVRSHAGKEADCPFCPHNWDKLTDGVWRDNSYQYGDRWVRVKIIEPLNPVVPGHVLVICDYHTPHMAVTNHYGLVGILMDWAAHYVDNNGMQANIITSVGPAATQTVPHMHVHIVPRTPGDGVVLPWTFQKYGGLQRRPGFGQAARGAYRYATRWISPDEPDPLA